MDPADPVIRHARREDVREILAMIQELADYERESSSVQATVDKLLATIAFAPSPEGDHPPSAPATGPSLLLHATPEVTFPIRPARCLLIFPPPSSSSSPSALSPGPDKVNIIGAANTGAANTGAANTGAANTGGADTDAADTGAATLLPATSTVGASPAGMALYFYNYSTWRARPGIYLEDLFVRPAARGKGLGKALLAALAREVVAMGGARLEWSVLRWNKPSIGFYERIGAKRMEDWVGMRVDGDVLVKLAGGWWADAE